MDFSEPRPYKHYHLERESSIPKSFSKHHFHEYEPEYRHFPRKKVVVVEPGHAHDVQELDHRSWTWILWPLILLILAILLLNWWNKKAKMEKGRLIIAASSTAPRSLATENSLSKADLVIDNIQVHPVGQDKGWVNVSHSNQTIDLLNLRNAANRLPQVIADTRVPFGQYERVKLHVLRVNITDEKGSRTVYLPSNQIEFDAPFEVKKDGVTVLGLDIALNDSLFNALENGKEVKVFAPLINYESRDGSEVTIANKKLTLQKPGHLNSQGTVGMDINGKTEKGNGIPKDLNLIIRDGKIVSSNESPSRTFGAETKTCPTPRRSPRLFDQNEGAKPNVSPQEADSVADQSQSATPPVWRNLPAFSRGCFNRQ